MIGLAIFGVGSALCSVSVSPEMLIGMRALQAIGGSMLGPVALAIINSVFPDPRERAQAIGIWGAGIGVGGDAGPVIGGVLVDAFDWRAVFWINLPIVVAAMILVHLVVPESKSGRKAGFDPAGQILALLLITSLTFAIIEGGEQTFTAVPVLIAAAVAAISCVAFVVVEHRVPNPMLDLRFFRSMPFALATVVALLVFFAFAGFLFVATLYLQDTRGLTPLQAGLAVLPMAAANVACAPLSGRMVGKVGPRPPMLIASVMLIAGASLLTQLGPTTPLALFIVAGVLVGGSLGTINAPITNTAVSGMPGDMSGVAGATASTARQLGQSLGVAVLGASLTAGENAGLAFTDAAAPGWWILVATGGVIAVLAVLVGTKRARASEEAVQQTF